MTTDDIHDMGPFVARLGRFGQRLGESERAHPWVVDVVVVALVFAVFCIPDLVNGSAIDADAPRAIRAAFTDLPVPVMLMLQGGLVLPLLLRRRMPWPAYIIVWATFAVQWALGAVLRADVALFIALYNLALRGRIRRLPWACGTVLAAMTLVTVQVSTVVSAWVALFFLLSAPTAALALGLAVRVRRAQLAGLRERAARLEIERDQRGRLAVATERARVAREMHDVVGHNLSVMITLADAGAYATDVTPHRSKQALVLIGDTGRQALDELRRVLGLLRETHEGHLDEPELSPQPGIADIDVLCAGVRAAGLDVVYRTAGNLDALDGGVQLMVHRIVQEALTNTLKHAGAGTRVQLGLQVDGTRMNIRVQDTGAVSRTDRLANKEGHGLVGMRERVALYGGSLSAGPAPGGGWTVDAVLDLNPRGGAV
ncbi:sensor histidine kinase [Streptomyces sp. NPDC058464]|uniref:sensor histidine kinase n=1 Tax=Streptomyces sp. NPDC058464 TaxID=3346511 RepID=UPI003648AF0C